MPRITISKIKSLQPGKQITCSHLVGFTASRPGNGGPVQYRARWRIDGKAHVVYLGTETRLTIDQAREKARQVLSMGRGEHLPASAVQKRVRRKTESPTVSALWDRYLEEHARPNNAPATIERNVRLYRKHIERAFGKRKVLDIDRDDVMALRERIAKSGQTSANRAMSLLGKMFSLAEVWEMIPRGSSPAFKLPRFRERRRLRYLSPSERVRLFEALDKLQHTATRQRQLAAIRWMALTGMRPADALRMRWGDIDTDSCSVTLVTKAGLMSLQVHQEAIDFVQQLPRGDDHTRVFEVTDIKHAWSDVCRSAGIKMATPYTLRHTFAASILEAGGTLGALGPLMGHLNSQTTKQYEHLAETEQRRLLRASRNKIKGGA